MVYARYVLLIRVPFLGYSHNLFLSTWLNQGLVGILGLVWLIVSFFLFVGRALGRGFEHTGPLFHGAWLGATATLLHGLTDACQYAAGWPFVPFFGLLGLAVASGRRALPIGPETSKGRVVGRPSARALAVAGLALCAILIGLAFSWRPIAAMGYANAGAVAQARGELDGALSTVERRALLSRAGDFYERALVYNPADATAHYRLGLLALDAGEYGRAVEHLGAAHGALPGHPGMRKALGLAYVWVGRLDEGEALLAGLPDIVEELNVWGWWRSQQEEMELAANAYRVSLRLQPDQDSVRRALSALEQE